MVVKIYACSKLILKPISHISVLSNAWLVVIVPSTSGLDQQLFLLIALQVLVIYKSFVILKTSCFK